MRRLVQGFSHRPGLHCGSTALADALRTVGVDLSEELALGLGAGLTFLALESPGFSPTRSFLGRSVSYEHDLCARLGVPFLESIRPSFDEAWGAIVAEIEAGRPVLALTDLRYLPYYATKTHFNGHRLVIAGYDEAHAYVADTHFPGLQAVPLADLRAAMESDAPPLVTTDCFFGTLRPPTAPVDPVRLVPDAIRANARHMREEGLPALESFAASVGAWSEAPDAAWCARFAGQVIEKRGNGGGLFRAMYARFLDQAGLGELAALTRRASERWTTLSTRFFEAELEPARSFAPCAAAASRVVDAERALWAAAERV